MSDLVGNPEDRFSHNEAHIKVGLEGGSKLHRHVRMRNMNEDINNNAICLGKSLIIIFQLLIIGYVQSTKKNTQCFYTNKTKAPTKSMKKKGKTNLKQSIEHKLKVI